MYLPDIIENMENAAEAWAYDNIKYDPETKKEMFQCDCGEWEELSKGEVVSDNPYAIPICGKCWLKFCEQHKDKIDGIK
tara:strand:- start:16510 stop:16746 length:237 start_codon:yes stop_codon:yes gene_type:complete